MADSAHPAPFEAYSGDRPFVFISYAHLDSYEVFKDLVWLHEVGFRVWYDEGIDPGNEWPEEIAIAVYAQTLIRCAEPGHVDIEFTNNTDVSGAITGSAPASCQLPLGDVIGIPVDSFTRWNLWIHTKTVADLSKQLPLGKYTFLFPGKDGNNYCSTIRLKSYSSCKNFPYIKNYSDVVNLSAAKDITMLFDSIEQPTDKCFTSPHVQISDVRSGARIYYGDVWGTHATSQLIPPNLFVAGKDYKLCLTYVTRVDADKLGWVKADYSSYTEFDKESQITFTAKP
ncbi:MAG TPA: toll/interleukin-1 receptor domain-containing protein [Fimbriimonadaceae bacterium]|jgi:hypothetical protein